MPSSSSPVYKQQKNSLETKKWISLPSLSVNLVNWELLHKYCPCWTNETLKQMDMWLNGHSEAVSRVCVCVCNTQLLLFLYHFNCSSCQGNLGLLKSKWAQEPRALAWLMGRRTGKGRERRVRWGEHFVWMERIEKRKCMHVVLT